MVNWPFGKKELAGNFTELLSKLTSDENVASAQLQQVKSLSSELPNLAEGIAVLNDRVRVAAEYQRLLSSGVASISADRKSLSGSFVGEDSKPVSIANKELAAIITELENSKKIVLAHVEQSNKVRAALIINLKSLPEDIETAELAAAHLMELLRNYDIASSILSETDRKGILNKGRSIETDDYRKSSFTHALHDTENLMKIFAELRLLRSQEAREAEVADAINKVLTVFHRAYGASTFKAGPLFDPNSDLNEATWRSGNVNLEHIALLNKNIFELLKNCIITLERLLRWANTAAQGSERGSEIKSIVIELYTLIANKFMPHNEETEIFVAENRNAVAALEAEAGSFLTHPPEDLSPLLGQLRKQRGGFKPSNESHNNESHSTD